MASRLLLLKSLRLLPGPEPEPVEADLIGWEEEVRQRLEEYRAYKQMAQSLMERASSEPFSFPPPARTIEVVGQEQPLEVELLVEAFQSILARIPPRPIVVTGRTWTLDEKLGVLDLKLAQGPIDVLAVIMESEDRLEAVVTFVALLELLRRGRIRIRQRQRFGPILAELRG
jgi:segregation and condensation protein A